MDDAPVFRAPKRRKTARVQEAAGEEGIARSSLIPVDRSATPDDTQTSEVVKVLKRPTAVRSGVAFAAAVRHHNANEDEATEVAAADAASQDVSVMSNRFVGATGQRINVDKHMVEYVDNRMRSHHSTNAAQSTPDSTSQLQESPSRATAGQGNATSHTQHQLSEVQLPSLTRKSNRTENGQNQNPNKVATSDVKHSKKSVRARRPRLGRDGKPLKPRPRYRRPSEDVARDALVEQVLHEHKLDHSYMSDASTSHSEEDVSGDEAFAERFKQGFMDQIVERQALQQQRNKPPAQSKAEIDKGPKLGGSRTARARMQASQANEAGHKR